MSLRSLAAVALLAGAVACAEKQSDADTPPPPPRARVLADVPSVNGSIVTDTSGSEDAERLSMMVQVSLDSIVRFYRQRLPELGWRIQNAGGDTVQATLVAAKDSATLWVRVQRLGMGSAEYTLIGAVAPADTRAVPP
ncbi:MAG: hypothetical protein HYR48_03350 [Gemmatimonadetes bacterium]|nr:hypothetical protein [Gemmatimonadota bacterium]